jgi:hypothetical protein
MAFILNKLNIPFEAFSTMPSSLKSYKSVFISLGSSSPAHILTSAEEARIIAYLNNGGNLYIEGYYFMFFPPASTLPAWLNFNIQNSPLYFFKTLQGIEGSETANMQFKNASAKTVSIKEINYGTAAFTLLQSPEGKPIQFASANNNYKTIASAVDFGYLTDSLSPSTKHELMKVYLDFFGVDTTGLDVFFHSSATEGCVNQVFSFTDDSPEPMDSYAWQFPGGNPGFSNQKNPTVTYAEPGIYDVTLSVSKGLLHRSSTKNAYIQTNACSGAPTNKPIALIVFPNPAKGLTMLSLPSVPHGYTKAELLDAAGKLLRTYHLNSQESTCSLNLEGIKPGFYILSVSGNNVQVLNRKLMVN